MKRFTQLVNLLLVILICLSTTPIKTVQAQSTDPYDLIAAVNALRASKGVPQLEVDAKLMAIAQNHSEYQASIGTWTHEGSGGSLPRDRAIAAGYGNGASIFISENVAVMRYEASYDDLIFDIWADEVHWTTMTSSIYTHVGAGIKEVDGSTYYTLDVGYISGQMGDATAGPTYTPDGKTTSTAEERTDETPVPVYTATQHEDGTIIHVIEAGQAVWSIALAYGKSILDIASLNKLDPNNPLIYAGQEIIIQPSFTITTSPTVTRTPRPPTRTPLPTFTPRPSTQTPTITQTLTATPKPLIPGLPTADDVDKRTAGIAIMIISSVGLVVSLMWSFLPGRKKTENAKANPEKPE
ncbi:MAG: LysM peptidoglycan-binding domain-containing protein [Anaerolineaceae bacterium]|nr:LysM peptidoglycan-binding domain-containing protein [Anaerolineaceae bacterium]